MAIPEVIPIAHEPGRRTDTIGRYEGGQFFASLTGAKPRSFDRRTTGDRRREYERFYAVLHRFNRDGFHLGSEVWEAGRGVGLVARAEARLGEWLATLPGLVYGPIAVRPFRIVVDDVVFGLIPHRYTEAGEYWERVELAPDDLSFAPPWDGLYDT